MSLPGAPHERKASSGGPELGRKTHASAQSLCTCIRLACPLREPTFLFHLIAGIVQESDQESSPARASTCLLTPRRRRRYEAGSHTPLWSSGGEAERWTEPSPTPAEVMKGKIRKPGQDGEMRGVAEPARCGDGDERDHGQRTHHTTTGRSRKGSLPRTHGSAQCGGQGGR